MLQDLREAGVPNESAEVHIQPILYRPFDVRYTFYTGKVNAFHERPRPEVMRHLLRGRNLALIVGRFGAATGDDEWNIVFVARHMVDLNIFRRGGGEVFPLYLYSEAEGQGNLLGSGDRVNLSEEFRHALAHALGNDAPPAPESTLAYIYALLHSNAYRSRYAEFLRRDFPRIPLPPSREVFDQLAAYGQQLIQYHLLEHPDLEVPRCKFYGEGDGRVERVRYDDAQHQVWINSTQYFEPVPPEVWAFRVGGYAVSEKWLADRKGRTLSLDERLTYQRVITALTETIRLQAAIDTVCKTAWGWF
jgi:predicted helicase